MTTSARFGAQRLAVQQIARSRFETPGDLVAWLGAVQAQDYAAAKWALGLRLPPGTTDEAIERALADGTILRTHALRSTWQLVTPADIRWIVALVAPRQIARSARRDQELELDAVTLRRSRTALEKALRDGRHLTRAELATVLEKARISSGGQRLAHLLGRAELDGLICSGARRGKQSTYALLDHRAKKCKPLARDEALARLARRYFQSRGPATVSDFCWWSGLSPAEARAGLESIKSTLVSDVVASQTYFRAESAKARHDSQAAYLLPAFDEYLVGYRNRDAVLGPEHVKRLNAGGGMLAPCVVINGRVIGTWRRVLGKANVSVELSLFEPPTSRQAQAIAGAARRYGAFLGVTACVSTG
ncbi:MAG TPA: winged helix DNA-binding domain-containing protein [Polyangiaceae bacterium]|nr:winged helix DNA-binding domain-containing protein [Polyangiaceae bacterium]